MQGRTKEPFFLKRTVLLFSNCYFTIPTALAFCLPSSVSSFRSSVFGLRSSSLGLRALVFKHRSSRFGLRGLVFELVEKPRSREAEKLFVLVPTFNGQIFNFVFTEGINKCTGYTGIGNKRNVKVNGIPSNAVSIAQFAAGMILWNVDD